jgi:hypothetical protein
MKLFAQEKVIQSVESSPKYQAAYTVAQAGGMNGDDCPLDQATRVRVADPLKEAKALLTDALCHNPQHDDACEARRFAEHNSYLPANHPARNLQPACNCWVGRMAEWLKSNP